MKWNYFHPLLLSLLLAPGIGFSLTVDMVGTTTTGAGGEFPDYSAEAGPWADASVTEGGVTLTVTQNGLNGDVAVTNWSTSNYKGPGSEINYQRGIDATDPAASISSNKFISFIVSSPSPIKINSISVNQWRNGGAAATCYQLAYEPDPELGVWGTEDLVASPVESLLSGVDNTFLVTHDPGTPITAAGTQHEFRLYNWGGGPQVNANTHLFEVTIDYSLVGTRDPELFAATPITLPATSTPAGAVTRSVEITNAGSATSLVVSGVSFAGGDAALFTSAMLPPAISPGNQGNIEFTFTPTTVGSFSTTMEILSNDSASPASVDLTIDVVDDPFLAAPASFSFPSIAGSSQTDPVTGFVSISNTGVSENLNISDLSISGGDAGLFSLGSTLSILEPGQSGDIEITFTPNGTVGAFLTSLDITSNSTGVSPTVTTVTLNATVEGDPFLSAPVSLFLGQIVAGTPDAEFFIEISNTGASEVLEITDVQFSGDSGSLFTDPLFPEFIDPGTNGTIDVLFDTPTTPGTYFATMEISSSSDGNPITLVQLEVELIPEFPAEAATLEIAGNTTGSPGGDFLDYSLNAAGPWDASSVTDGTATLTATQESLSGITSVADWNPNGYLGVGTEINYIRNSPSTTDLAGSIEANKFVSLIVNSTTPIEVLAIYASQWRNGNASATNYQLVYEPNAASGSWEVGDAIGLPVSTTLSGPANAFDVEHNFGGSGPTGTEFEFRLYNWGENAAFSNGNTHLYNIRVIYIPAGETPQLRVESFTGNMINLSVDGLPEGETFHLRSSPNLQGFLPLNPPFDFNSTTTQPFAIPVNPGAQPRLFFQAFEGASPSP